MSRIGYSPVAVPDGVTVEIKGKSVSAKGKLGELSTDLAGDITIEQADGAVTVRPLNGKKHTRQMWGTARSVIDGLVKGVSEGFTRRLAVTGTGYRAQMQGNTLMLQLGLSHDVHYPVPDGVKINCPTQTEIEVSGADKQQVGQVAAEIRAFRPPEPYKGKGVRYSDEYILRKEGKKK